MSGKYVSMQEYLGKVESLHLSVTITMPWGVVNGLFLSLFAIVHNILKCNGKHSFSYVCYQNIPMFFFTLFTLTFLP